MIELKALQKDLINLSKDERLKLAHWLLGSVVDSPDELPTAEVGGENPLTEWVGLFASGPADTAARAEEILEAEIGETGGFGDS